MVFSGEVANIKPSDSGGPSVAVTFKVERWWKQGGREEMTISSNVDDGANCGFQFAVGQKWLVYAHASPRGELWTGSCTRTKGLAVATEDLKVLGKGKAPTKARKNTL